MRCRFILLALTLTLPAYAHEPVAEPQVGTYYLNRSLDKTVVVQGSRTHTLPGTPGSGTTYYFPQRQAPSSEWRVTEQKHDKGTRKREDAAPE